MTLKSTVENFFTNNSKGQDVCVAICSNDKYKQEILVAGTVDTYIPNTQSEESFATERTLNFFRGHREKYNCDNKRASAQSEAVAQTTTELEGLGD